VAKRYATIYSNGHKEESSLACEARNFRNYGDGQSFELSGKPVTPDAFFAAVDAAMDAAHQKKLGTHKQVRVLYGNSATCYVTKWVRRA
jgi:hypothetical protein